LSCPGPRRETSRYRSYEQALSVGWGTGLEELGDTTNYLGVSFKFINSKLASTPANSIAFDAGYIKRFKHGLRLGATLQNMGPSVRYETGVVKCPIPFTLNLAFGSKHDIPVKDLKLFQIAWETRLSKELVVLDKDRNPEPFFKAFFTEWADSSFDEELHEILYNTGIEIGIFNTGYFRHGYLIDNFGEHYEFHWGIGLSLFNHFNFDWGIISSPKGYMVDFARNFNKESEGASGARDRQWQISFTFSRLNSWRRQDLKWWRYPGH
jgi:hypothetical protein